MATGPPGPRGSAEGAPELQGGEGLHSAVLRRCAAPDSASATALLLPGEDGAPGLGRVSYASLGERIGALRDAIAVQCEEGAPVAVAASGAAYAAAVVAAMASGRPFVPIDARQPAERNRWILKDSGAAGVIGEAGVEPRRGGRNAPGAAALAYICYTSGSTGRPKGVLGSHAAMLNRFAWMWERYPFRRGEVCCQRVASATFVDAIWETLGPLSQGVPLLIVPQGIRGDPAALLSCALRGGVTRMLLVPSLLALALDTAAEQIAAAVRAGLWLWSVSGEALPVDVAVRFLEVCGACGDAEAASSAVLLNLYGSTEVAADVTFHEMRVADLPRLRAGEGAAGAGASAPIGTPICHCRALLLEAGGAAGGAWRSVAAGSVGELFLAGKNLAEGFLLDGRCDDGGQFLAMEPAGADASGRETFRQVAGCDGRGTAFRAFRSHDLCQLGPDGRLRFVGRSDQVVKVRGQRIDLLEVESALRDALPRSGPARGARGACAVVFAPRESGESVDHGGYDRARGRRVVACVGLAGEALSADEHLAIQGRLAERLPAAALPAEWLLAMSLPLLPSGKLHRRGLCEMAASAAAAARAGAELRPSPAAAGEGRWSGPWTLETLLVCASVQVILAEQLGIAASSFAELSAKSGGTEGVFVGPAMAFTSLGGDSLLSVRVLNRLAQRCLAPPAPRASIASGAAAPATPASGRTGRGEGAAAPRGHGRPWLRAGDLVGAPSLGCFARRVAAQLRHELDAAVAVSFLADALRIALPARRARAQPSGQEREALARIEELLAAGRQADVADVLLEAPAAAGGMTIAEDLAAMGDAAERSGRSCDVGDVHRSAAVGDVDGVRRALELGGAAEVRRTTKHGWTAAHGACSCREWQKGAACLELLIDGGALPHVRDKSGLTLLHQCARSGSVACLSVLARRMDGSAFARVLEANDRWYRRPMHWAALHGHAEMVEALLRHGAAPCPRVEAHQVKAARRRLTQKLETPLHLILRRLLGSAGAPEERDTRTLALLLEAGADVSLEDQDGVPAAALLDQWRRRASESEQR